MTRRLILSLCLTAAVLCAIPAAAPARGKAPQISLVSPMRVKVGSKLVLRGRNFSASRKRNTVMLTSASGRVAFAKAVRASRTRMTIVVPVAVATLLAKKGGVLSSTRFRLRALVAGRLGSYTSKRISPVVVASGAAGKSACGSHGPSTNPAVDSDHDLLPDVVEVKIGTNPCLADTDGDGMTDGWEYYSAKDLNLKAVPYPGKRPYTNPLYPDANVDHDGDGLTAGEEFKLWRYTGSSFDPSRIGGPDNESPLGYSDGTQTSRPHEVPQVPAFKSASYGLAFSPPPYPQVLDRNGDGLYSDDERDADADGLSNYVETHGPGQSGWWPAFWQELNVDPWPKTYYGAFSQRQFTDLDPTNPDVDGDGLLDGEDDQDFDGVPNYVEMYTIYPQTIDVRGTPRYGNAFNPCAPDPNSRTCDRYRPFGG